MKKKIALSITLICLLLSGCSDVAVEPTIKTVQIEYSQFNLVADEVTGIVYIDNVIEEHGEIGLKTNSYHIYTPYISRNGKYCKFFDGSLQEVSE